MIHSSRLATKRRTSGLAPLEIEHDVGDPLARPVIGQLAAAPALVDTENARFDHVGRDLRWCRRCREAGAPGARPVPRAVPAAIAAARASIAATASS